MLIDLHYSGEHLPIENIDSLRPLARTWFACGSRVTCDPPAVGTDRDVMVLVSNPVEFAVAATQDGFEIGGSMSPADAAQYGRFVSMRRGAENMLFTGDQLFFDKFMAATTVCKRLNVLAKEDRIALFQAVLYGKAC